MKQVLLLMLFVATVLLSTKICASMIDIRNENHLNLLICLEIPRDSTLPFGSYIVNTGSSDGKPIQAHSSTLISSKGSKGNDYHNILYSFNPGESRELVLKTYRDDAEDEEGTVRLSLSNGVITYDKAVVEKVETEISTIMDEKDYVMKQDTLEVNILLK